MTRFPAGKFRLGKCLTWAGVRAKMGIQEKIAEIQLEMARTQKNKATEVCFRH